LSKQIRAHLIAKFASSRQAPMALDQQPAWHGLAEVKLVQSVALQLILGLPFNTCFFTAICALFRSVYKRALTATVFAHRPNKMELIAVNCSIWVLCPGLVECDNCKIFDCKSESASNTTHKKLGTYQFQKHYLILLRDFLHERPVGDRTTP
jgi:hypothetical protein